MKFEIGDKIIVLHSEEEGKVVDFINHEMLLIEVGEVQFPVYIDQIDFPYFKLFSEKKPISKKKTYVDDIPKEKTISTEPFTDDVSIRFIPVYIKDVFGDEVVEKMKIYLVNQNDEAFQFNYHVKLQGNGSFSLKNNIRPFADFYLHDISFLEISNNPVFNFEFSLVKKNKRKAPFFETSIKLRSKQLFNRLEEMKFSNDPSFSFQLFKEYPDKTEDMPIDISKFINTDYRVYDATKAKDYLPKPNSVIDLHIHQIDKNWQDLSSAEMLQKQIQALEKFLELSIAHEMKSVIVIHGIGEGVLKDKIHSVLQKDIHVASYVNEFHPLYGFGATEIFFKN